LVRTSPPDSRVLPVTAVAPWRKLGLSAGALSVGAEGALGYLHPALGEALAVADVAVPMIIIGVLLTAILCGSKETHERAFRLLRWIANRPEPPAPQLPSIQNGRRG
jgi:hypothetical protein